jgi:hypothetical protein
LPVISNDFPEYWLSNTGDNQPVGEHCRTFLHYRQRAQAGTEQASHFGMATCSKSLAFGGHDVADV